MSTIMAHLFHPRALDWIGFIPEFLDDEDPRPAVEQLDANYKHGGGWRPMEGWTMADDATIDYPGDPPQKPVAVILFRNEKIYIYEHSWVAVVQKDGSFEIARMD